MSSPPAHDVLVAGAGPVGLAAAYELARRGMRVRLVDARNGPATTSRAIAVHPRTLETFDQMGLADRFLARGRRIEGFTMYRNGRRLVRLEADYSTLPTRYPFTLCVDQVITEELLRAAAGEVGVDVEWGVRLETFEQDADGVRATLRDARGAGEVRRAAWLVGCDGGHSTVRRTLGLSLVGRSSEEWMLADATVRTVLPPDSIYWISVGNRTLMMVPMSAPGRWRLLDTAEVSDRDPERVAARFARKLTAGLGSPVEVDRPTWVSVFTFQQRMVERMRVGRCLVVGDAAHVHSPASGQGLNTGLQEAYNLGWKLAMVADGDAAPELLDSYGAERVPIGASLLGSTKRATFMVQLRNSVANLALPVVFGVVRSTPPVRRGMQRKILGGISGLRIGYPDSPLTPARPPDPDGPRPRPGERVSQVDGEDAAAPGWAALRDELRGTRWTLLVADGVPSAVAAADGLGRRHRHWLSVRVVRDAGEPDATPGVLPDPDSRLRSGLRLPGGAWLLIRPDGYVGDRGTHLTADAISPACRAACLTGAVRAPEALPSPTEGRTR